MTILELVSGLIAEGASTAAIQLAIEAAEHPTPKRSAVRKVKARTSLASDAQPNEADRASALAAGLYNGHFREQWQRFRDHHLAKGSLMADWSAAWRTWLGNMRRYESARGGSVGAALDRLDFEPRPMLPGLCEAPGEAPRRLLPKR